MVWIGLVWEKLGMESAEKKETMERFFE